MKRGIVDARWRHRSISRALERVDSASFGIPTMRGGDFLTGQAANQASNHSRRRGPRLSNASLAGCAPARCWSRNRHSASARSSVGRWVSSSSNPSRLGSRYPTCINAGGFSDLERIRTLPGMTRAIGRTLAKVWDADLSLRDSKDRGSRLSDLALIEDRVRATLPPGARRLMLPV